MNVVDERSVNSVEVDCEFWHGVGRELRLRGGEVERREGRCGSSVFERRRNRVRRVYVVKTAKGRVVQFDCLNELER